MKHRIDRSRVAGRPAALLLAATCLSPVAGSLPAHAQTLWTGGGSNNLFTTPANWTNGVPTGSTPGTFGASGQTTIDIAGTNAPGSTIPGLTFNAGAPAYTFVLGTGASSIISGAGIVNASANAPTLLINGGDTFNFGGNLNLSVGSLGNATVNVATQTASLTLGLGDGSPSAPTAGTANITSSGIVFFRNRSTAASATIDNSRSLTFVDSSTAGNATITNTDSLLFFELEHRRQRHHLQQRRICFIDQLRRFELGRQRDHRQQHGFFLPGTIDGRERHNHQQQQSGVR